MAKMIAGTELKFRAILFADGPRGSYFQEWQCVKYPSLFIRVTGKKHEQSIRDVFVKKQNLDVLTFPTVEQAIPFARKHNWNPYEKESNDRPGNPVNPLGRSGDSSSDGDKQRRGSKQPSKSRVVHPTELDDRSRRSKHPGVVGQSSPRSKGSRIRRKD